MGYFEQEQWMSQNSLEKNPSQAPNQPQNQTPDQAVEQQVPAQAPNQAQAQVPEQNQKKKGRYLPQILILFFVVFILASVVYIFASSVKGVWPKKELPAVSDGEVLLSAVIYSEDNPVAIVDGEIAHEGDMIGDVRIVKIHKGGVDFETAEKQWSQDLPEAKEGVHSGISGLPVLLVLGSDGCPACRKMKPILNNLRSKYSEKFVVKHIDPWADKAAGERYGVRAIPTLIFYDSKGKEAFRHVGYFPEADILAAWGKIGVKL